MKAFFRIFFTGAALLFAFTTAVSARRFLFLESAYVGDGWFRYTISAPDDPYFLFVDVGAISIYEPGMSVLELGPPPPRWTNNPSTEPAVTWVSEDINGWNVRQRPYSTSFLLNGTYSSRRGTATLIFSLATITGWNEWGPIVSGNIAGYWNSNVLVPGAPDGSGTNLLTSLPGDLPDPLMAELLRTGKQITGIAYDYPNTNTMRLEGSRDMKVWTNIAYIFGAPGRTTWTSSSPLNDFGNFFRVLLVAEGHATVLPPLTPASPRLVLAGAVLPWLGGGAAILFVAGLYLALVGSPPDYQQGDTVRIMYIHVPSAWMAMMGYGLLGAAGASALIWRHPLADVAAEAIAPVGAGFTFVALVTGSLWGKPTWGTYWVWDARLTSFLVLFFLYVGHIALTHAFDDRQRGRRSAAIIAIVGLINLPIIKFSVDWWNTLHQPASISRFAKPALHPTILTPLLVMAIAFMLLFATLLLLRVRASIIEHRLQTLAMMKARR